MTATTHSTPSDSSPAANKTELEVEGMTCSNCARHVTEAIQSVPGVHSANVALDARKAFVRWTPGAQTNPPALIRAVEAAGYSARVTDDKFSSHEGHSGGWNLNLLIGVVGTVPLMIGEWVLGLGMTPWFRWFAFGIAAVVQVTAGAQFYRGAWKQLKRGGSNMDTLVALGSTTAFVYSAWAIFAGYAGHLYFMEAAAIITLISIGHWIEARVSVRASGALKKLLNLAPPTARRRSADGTEVEVPVSELRPNDIVALRPGDRIPTDAIVVEGTSAVDEAMLTGESAPLDKIAGREVYAGTTNLNGRLTVRVTATGEGTALAHVISAVQRAQTSRANIQRLGDRVSSIFVPIVVLIAIGAALWWGFAPEQAREVSAWLSQYLWHSHAPTGRIAAAVIVAAAVLIIACPCAMGLATPAAIMASSNAAAERGILIRDGVALEKAGEVTAIVFDKTGTLTAGKPSVAATWFPSQNSSAPDPAINTARELAVALTRHSTHPISRAVAEIGSSSEIEVADWQELSGSGLAAKWPERGNATVRLGSIVWLKESGVKFPEQDSFSAEWLGQGSTVVGLSADDALLALFAVKDAIKPGTADVVRRLDEQGFKIYMLTGDNALTAAGIARQVGIKAENVFAEVRPESKASFVQKLQDAGNRVAFVGDGINDAPALEQADLGIAVSRASDIAREAADIILLKPEIEAVPEALGLARATLRTIKQNLFWAFFYNAIGVPLAAFGFMSPVLCAAAMGFSDLIVIGNALRLRRWRGFPRTARN